ncbi:MAG: hypothetical protein J4F35_12080 [Candidatus Latescibacteria bacterium]|nr:hypothetical protein [Candidatus Latescibacterota bacterium]
MYRLNTTIAKGLTENRTTSDIRERQRIGEQLYAHRRKLWSLAVGLSTSAEREQFRTTSYGSGDHF